MTKIGVISDTHGLLRPQVMNILHGVDVILHAGDIGRPDVLTSLEALAPVVAVRGNVDRDEWASAIPDIVKVIVNDVKLQLIHDAHDVKPGLRLAGYHGVISGHSHRPTVVQHDGLLWVNPGSAGPRRFNLPVTLGLLSIKGTSMKAKIVKLL